TKQFVASNTAKVISLYRLPSPLIIQADFWSVFIDYATVEFMKCEVNDWDKASFEAAMRASFEQWGVKAADEYGTADAYNAAVDTYITGVLAKFDAATTAGKQEIVLTQKYMHLFTQGFEAWSEYRRTGFPKSIVKPGELTNGTIAFVASNPTGTDIVPRLLYDSNEYTLNKANVEAAATSIGGDKYNTKLWWAK
ncbi:MAG: SusD/RagB family nutrient-binding outer membrane lipoprotein, partial [Bacteroidales bacterium]|nr:SusD/RagB family nutrient-binding outer membrane lipoprotein [Bacteroidales bacterium]